jgi:hypothetical protein
MMSPPRSHPQLPQFLRNLWNLRTANGQPPYSTISARSTVTA